MRTATYYNLRPLCLSDTPGEVWVDDGVTPITGGRHPMGYVGINKTLEQYEINSSDFKSMYEDHSLKYVVNK